jgi:hypothetical protein
MVVSGAVMGPIPVHGVVYVIETSTIGRKCEASQVAARKNVRKNPAAFDIKEFKGPGSLSTLFDLVEEQMPIGRDTKRLHRRVSSGTAFGRIDEELVLAIDAFTKEDAGLFLAPKPFAEVVSATDLLDRVVSLNVK